MLAVITGDGTANVYSVGAPALPASVPASGATPMSIAGGGAVRKA